MSWFALGATVSHAQPWLPTPVVNFTADMDDATVRATIDRLVTRDYGAGKSPVERIEHLRHWLHRLLPVTDGQCDLWNLGADHNADPLGKLLNMVERRLGGYHCGGQAEIARKVYALMGYETFTLNFGIEHTGATHVTTFVKIIVNGVPKWTIQDAYFDCTLRSPDGEYLGYAEVLALIEAGEIDHLVVDQSPTRKPFLHSRPDMVPRLNRRYHLESDCVREWPHFEEFSVAWNFRLLSTSMFDVRRQFRARLNGHTDPRYLFVLPLGYNGSDVGLEMLEAARQVQSRLLRLWNIPEERLTEELDLPPEPLDPIVASPAPLPPAPHV